MNIETVMHNLKIVGMVGEQDKLITAPRFGLRPPTTLRAIMRRWYGENRDADLQNLRNLMSSAICIAQLNSVEAHRGTALHSVSNDRLIQAVCTALSGMQTLTRTYHDDQETCAKIELLIQECKDRVNAIRPCTYPHEAEAPASRGTPVGIPYTRSGAPEGPPPSSPLGDL